MSTGGTFIFSLLAVTVTLSLGRLHRSYMDARPGAHVGIKVTASLPPHPSHVQSWEEKKEKRKKGKKNTKKNRERKLIDQT